MQDWLHPSNWPLLMVAFTVLAYALFLWLTRRRRANTAPRQAQSWNRSSISRSPLQPPAERPLSIPNNPGTVKIAAHDLSPGSSAPIAMMDRCELAEGALTSELIADVQDVTAPVLEDAGAGCAQLLHRAQSQLQAGDTKAAAATLRETILLAVTGELPDHHAAARLELGELARQDGDLITACEHWQIARALFQDLKNGARVKTTEARMRDHGCPTDWVLTDF
jgi:hypothetical protein